ncbi:unnamed protein product [Nezara viridula]|uniref:Uncharacterized protein n=1 Tax=Nezara viridula TaxID=85310 RepID=A0A9P0GWA6_NEZVI|nr:unnamed protein product [Nezara viridula]
MTPLILESRSPITPNADSPLTSIDVSVVIRKQRTTFLLAYAIVSGPLRQPLRFGSLLLCLPRSLLRRGPLALFSFINANGGKRSALIRGRATFIDNDIWLRCEVGYIGLATMTILTPSPIVIRPFWKLPTPRRLPFPEPARRKRS